MLCEWSGTSVLRAMLAYGQHELMDTSQTTEKDKDLASASDGLCQSMDVNDLKF